MTDGDVTRVEVLTPSEVASGIRWTATGVEVVDPLITFDAFQSAVEFAGKATDAAKWALGDLLLYGESRWPHEYAQVLDASRLSEHQIRRYRYAAERVQRSRRRENLSFSHHEAVASLDPADQLRLLAQASENGWNLVALRERIADVRAVAPPTRISAPPEAGLALASVDAARNLSTVRTTLATVASRLDPEHQDAIGIPQALRAVDDVGKTVRRVAKQLARPSVLDAARKVVAAGVKQRALADPAYIVPASVFEELAARVAEAN